MSGSLSSVVFLLRRLAESVSTHLLRMTYFAFFQSRLTYGVLSWGHSSILERIFAIQRRAVRVVAGLDYREDCRTAFVHLKIMTLPSLYIFECLKYVTTNRAVMPQQNAVHSYDTRANSDIRQPHLRLLRSRNGRNYFGVKFYNALSTTFRSLPQKQFLQRLKCFLIEQAPYSIDDFLRDPPELCVE